MGGGAAPGAPAPNAPNLGLGLADSAEGVVVERVFPGSPAAAGLAPGDIIVEVNRRPVARAADAAKQMGAASPGTPILLKVKRDGKPRFVAIERP